MDPPPPLAFLVFLFAGWTNRQEQAVINDLRKENRCSVRRTVIYAYS